MDNPDVSGRIKTDEKERMDQILSSIQAESFKRAVDAGEIPSLRSRAFICAWSTHQGQIDKAGEEYFHHPLHVAKQFENEDDDAAYVVSILHDVLEDTPLTAKDLLCDPWRIPEPMVRSIEVITRRDSDKSYLDYIQRVKLDPVARRVKIEDLRHNMDLTRLHRRPSEIDMFRQRRYQQALEILETKDKE